tara:strand:+ start:55 stop:231 length:177 start_codon:yes stop_codon:yes gene_type:complete
MYKPCLLKLKKLPHKSTMEERCMGQKLFHYICEIGHKTMSTSSNSKLCNGQKGEVSNG